MDDSYEMQTFYSLSLRIIRKFHFFLCVCHSRCTTTDSPLPINRRNLTWCCKTTNSHRQRQQYKAASNHQTVANFLISSRISLCCEGRNLLLSRLPLHTEFSSLYFHFPLHQKCWMETTWRLVAGFVLRCWEPPQLAGWKKIRILAGYRGISA